MPPKITLLAENYGESIWLYEFAKVDARLELHSHAFMHRALIPDGSRFEWFTEKNRDEVTGPHVLTFPAGVPHGMRALNDGAAFFAIMPAKDGRAS